MLLLQPNEVVTIDRLVDAVWGDDPPATARNQVHTCVSRLRRVLRAAGVPDDVLVTEPIGYRIKVVDDDLDSLVFARLVDESRMAVGRGDLDDACMALRNALALWRGPALSGITGVTVKHASVALEEQRSTAFEECTSVELRLGLVDEVIEKLTDFVGRYPLRERLRGYLMTALYRAGRQADALRTYRQGRDLLVSELGIEPGDDLQQLHQRILLRDPLLLEGASPQPAPVRTASIPHGLPRDVAHFIGRDDVVAYLLGAVPDDPSTGPPVPAVLTIDGMAGVGKTSLAVHVALQVATRYPDGQLFVDLRGHSAKSPVEPAAALGSLLRQIGIPGQRIPESLDERIALWRTELAGRQILVVLDNAADAGQVSALLPGAARCLVLITSRGRIAPLEGARAVSLGELSASEAVRLLTEVVGNRITVEPDAAAEVARLCGYLPLALGIAAARLSNRPAWTVSDLAVKLREARPVLRELAVMGNTVAAAFSLSYDHLGHAQRRVFRLLGLHPGNDFDANAVAALGGIPVAHARDLVEELVDWHLVQSTAAGRYRLHDLLRGYARGLVEKSESDQALARLLHHYLHAGAAAAVYLDRRHGRDSLKLGESPSSVGPIVGLQSAIEWFDVEWQNLVAAAKLAYDMADFEHAARLPIVAWRYLWRRGYNSESVEIHECAVAAAAKRGNAEEEARAANYLASGYLRLNRWNDVLHQLQHALSLYRSIGDNVGQLLTMNNIAGVCRDLGRFKEALGHGEASLTLGMDSGLLTDTLLTGGWFNLGTIYGKVGRFEEALPLLRWSALGDRRRGDRYDEAVSIGEIGVVRARQGRHKLAITLLTYAARLKAELGNPRGEAETLSELGAAYGGLGQVRDALVHQRRALHIARQAGDVFIEMVVLNHLGRTLRGAGEFAEALELHRIALRLADRMPCVYEQARAHAGIAAAIEGRDPSAARRHWRQALVLFTEIGTPEQFEIEARLRGLGT